jgi:predicted outer membrane repeat protein
MNRFRNGKFVAVKLSIITIAFIVLMTGNVTAATILVTSTDDSGPGTLREALASAADGDTIDATGLSGRIILKTGELVVSKSVSVIGPGPAKLAIDGHAASRVFHITEGVSVTICSLTITNGRAIGDSPDKFGGGIYNGHATLTVSNCTLSGNSSGGGGGIVNDGSSRGSATLTVLASTLSANSAKGRGGGIFNGASNAGRATLTVSNCTFRGNSAANGSGGIDNLGAEGGTATLTVCASTFSGNSTAKGSGGGIINLGANGGRATLTVSGCTFSSNSAGKCGGGIHNDGRSGTATLTVNATTFSGNTAKTGGGIQNQAEDDNGRATLTVGNCTVSGNSAGVSGGGMYNYGWAQGSATLTLIGSTLSGNSAGKSSGGDAAAGSGGGIFNIAAGGGTATLRVSACTFSGNTARRAGGGINNFGGRDGGPTALTVSASTFSDNAAKIGGSICNDGHGSASLEIGNSILKTGASGKNIDRTVGKVTSRGYNLSSDHGGGFLAAKTDRINTDPLLGPLQDNGGPTFTHALLPDSPAIDRGKRDVIPSLVLDTDQRGFSRPVGSPAVARGDGSDIGAFEVQLPAPVGDRDK